MLVRFMWNRSCFTADSNAINDYIFLVLVLNAKKYKEIGILAKVNILVVKRTMITPVPAMILLTVEHPMILVIPMVICPGDEIKRRVRLELD